MLKSVTLLPVRSTEEMLRVALPEFVTVTAIGELVAPWVMVGKLTGFGVTVTAGAGGGGATPVPLSCTDWGLSGALSEIERVACKEPVLVGAKVMLMEQKLVGLSAKELGRCPFPGTERHRGRRWKWNLRLELDRHCW